MGSITPQNCKVDEHFCSLHCLILNFRAFWVYFCVKVMPNGEHTYILYCIKAMRDQGCWRNVWMLPK